MTFNIRTISWNCNGFKSSVYDINTLCNHYDIIFIQEHWLRNDELYLFNTVHCDFTGFGISAIQTDNGFISGRPYGGVGIIWRKSLAKYISIVQYEDNRIIGCNVGISDNSMLFVNVYLPYQCVDNHDDFVLYLGKLTAIINECTTPTIAIVGDFNAKAGTMFESELLQFVNTCNLNIADYEYFGRSSDTHTYVSDSHGTTSWLDHYVCSHSMYSAITGMKVIDRLPSSDHLPISATMYHSSMESIINDNGHLPKSAKTSNWSKSSPSDRAAYTSSTRSLLGDIQFPRNVMTCTDSTCTDSSHITALDTLYTSVCDALYRAGMGCIPSAGCTKASHHVIPGWNEYVREYHDEARQAYVTWRDMGKPRQGPTFIKMSTSRLQFKHALKQCQAMEDTARADALAASLSKKDMISFWKSIKTMNHKNVPLAPSINGISGERDICDVWQNHYCDILNCVKSDNNNTVVKNCISSIKSADHHIISPCDIVNAIKDLKSGKSVGFDLLAAEHFMYADGIICIFLSLLYTSFLIHGHLPSNFMKTILVPLLKNKTGDICDTNNYRPIALVTVSSKIIELVILNHIESYIATNDNQFGFKRKHGTDLCIYSLKNVVQYYKEHNSPVFACFLDASKAFDRVNFYTLFYKLVKCGVPLLIVRLLSLLVHLSEIVC